MRPNATNLITNEGNLPADGRTRMSIDENSYVFLMGVLTDLYSNPVAAVIREYSTNAWDSHVAAGNTSPIEIELPTSLNPQFIVRDFGVGLNVDEIVNVYSKYGASTKRDTNEATGMLGLGCKSALTYCSQFSVVGRQNGVQTTCLVTRDADGAGAIQVLDTCATDEPNGVEVRIPVSGYLGTFTDAAHNFYRFWAPGTVLVDGVEPDCVFDTHLSLDPDVAIVGDHGLNNDVIVMGNVPYAVPHRISDRLGNKAHVACRVEIGAVDFPPARESLQLTERTIDVLAEVGQFVDAVIDRFIRDSVDSAPTKWEALQAYDNWRDVAKLSAQPTYRGERIPLQWALSGWKWSVRYANRAERTHSLSITTACEGHTVLILNHPNRSVDKETRRLVKKAYPNHTYAIAVNYHDETNDWFTGVETVDYRELRPKTPRVGKGPRAKRTNKYEAWNGTWWTSTDLVGVNRRIVYIVRSQGDPSGKTLRKAWRKEAAQWCNTVLDATLVVIGTPDLNRFLRDHPTATTIGVAADAVIADLLRDTTSDARSSAAYDDSQLAGLGVVDAGSIIDPSLSTLIVRIQDCLPHKRNVLRARRIARERPLHAEGYTVPTVATSNMSAVADDILSLYPLVSANNYFGEHQIDYINAMYEYRKNH